MAKEAWLTLLDDDPTEWLLSCEEPAARWIALTELLDLPEGDPAVIAARQAVLSDSLVERLIDDLPCWGSDTQFGGHHSPAFAPNTLQLLADMGVRGGDDPRVERLLDDLTAHQEPDGRFMAFGKTPTVETPLWGAVLCDTHAITEVLVRFGRGNDPAVRAALSRMAADLAETRQGRAWPCIPHTTAGWRGPGRKGDFCPQVTLEALRTFARLPNSRRPRGLLDTARVSLRAWRMRAEEKPYMFGHGLRFRTVKWPTNWYDVHWKLDTLGRYPELWRANTADPGDRRALAEMAACMIAYNFGKGGLVTPRSCYRGYTDFSFGQKKRPSPFASARLLSVLRRFNGLANQIGEIDVSALPSSRSDSPTCVPPNN